MAHIGVMWGDIYIYIMYRGLYYVGISVGI